MLWINFWVMNVVESCISDILVSVIECLEYNYDVDMCKKIGDLMFVEFQNVQLDCGQLLLFVELVLGLRVKKFSLLLWKGSVLEWFFVGNNCGMDGCDIFLWVVNDIG